MARPKRPPHWKPSSRFGLAVAGTSYRHEALANIAKNSPGETAFAFFTARLVLDDANAADPLAVSVRFGEEPIGFLPASFCPTFRQLVSSLGPDGKETTIDAVVRNGLTTEEQTYSYSVWLDLPEDHLVGRDYYPSFREPLRLDPYPSLLRQADGAYVAHVWMDVTDRNELDRDLGVDTWTTESWSTVNFYVLNRQRIGLGFKVYQMDKANYESTFPSDTVDASLVMMQGRLAVLHVRATDASPTGETT